MVAPLAADGCLFGVSVGNATLYTYLLFAALDPPLSIRFPSLIWRIEVIG
jgi:hypothetical protein